MLDLSDLKKVDQFIIFSILQTRANRATVYEIKESIKNLWLSYNIRFSKAKLGVPTSTYFYQRLSRLVLLKIIERHGTRDYSINKEHFDEIAKFNISFMKALLGGKHV